VGLLACYGIALLYFTKYTNKLSIFVNKFYEFPRYVSLNV
jgi:hypothetical protein